jgi:hypothetical protein
VVPTYRRQPVPALSSFSLSPARCPVGPICRRQTPLRARAFSRCTVGHARQRRSPFTHPFSLTRGYCRSEPSPLEPPALLVVDVPTSVRFPATTHVPEPFLETTHTHSPLPAQLHTQPSTIAFSLALQARPGRPPPFTMSARSFCRHRWALTMPFASISPASVSATWDMPQFTLPSMVPSARAHRCVPRAAGEPPLSTQAFTVSLLPFKGPRVSSQGNQPVSPPIYPFHVLVWARLLAGV